MTVNEKRAPISSAKSDLELCMPHPAPEIAISSYSQGDLERMGANFYAVYQIAEAHRFGYLLTAIDVAEEEMRRTPSTITAMR